MFYHFMITLMCVATFSADAYVVKKEDTTFGQTITLPNGDDLFVSTQLQQSASALRCISIAGIITGILVAKAKNPFYNMFIGGFVSTVVNNIMSRFVLHDKNYTVQHVSTTAGVFIGGLCGAFVNAMMPID